MSVAAMAVEVRVKPMRRAAETAIADAAIFPQAPVRLAPEFRDLSRAAIASPHETHRHCAGGGASHHGQNDAARTFHGGLLNVMERTSVRGRETISITLRQQGKRKPIHSRDRAASGATPICGRSSGHGRLPEFAQYDIRGEIFLCPKRTL